MIPPALFKNKSYALSIVRNAVPAKLVGKSLHGLLDGLSSKELRILKKHEDLVLKVGRISIMHTAELVKEVKDDFGFEITRCHVRSDLWVNIGEDLLAFRPTWCEQTHFGWWLSVDDGEFDVWARNILMQEIRVNISMRYLRDKKSTKSSPVIDYGMYL